MLYGKKLRAAKALVAQRKSNGLLNRVRRFDSCRGHSVGRSTRWPRALPDGRMIQPGKNILPFAPMVIRFSQAPEDGIWTIVII